MPEQEVISKQQILRIGLIGARVCGDCNYVKVELQKRGLVSEKIILDYNNPIHQKFRDIAISQGDKNMPLICLISESGELTYFGAGVAMIHILKLAAREKDLQDKARQEEMVNA